MSRPRVLVVQHEQEVPPGLLAGWLSDAGCDLDVRRPDRGEELPEVTGPERVDGLVVLGGSRGAYDDEAWPWLPLVRRRIAEAAQAGTPTLGICLGHQLAAVALGGEVVRNPHGRHTGLTPVGWLPAAQDDPLASRVPGAARAAQWNNDVVSVLPPGATPLAESRDGSLQVARLADRVWGVQVHPEADAAMVGDWVAQDPVPGRTTAEFVTEMEDAAAELGAAWQPFFAAYAELVVGSRAGAAGAR